MLEKLALKDFQRHESFEVEFDQRVVTFVGPSDAGKSAIIRALRWLCTNQPQGAEFVRHGQKSSLVKLKVDGRWIARHRSGKDNSYRLDGRVLKAFGAGVPDPIAKLLNVGETNWQGQHDLPLWFCESPGEVSRRLNAIINLGEIDSALKNASDKVRRAESELDLCRERLKEAKGKVHELRHAKVFAGNLRHVEELANNVKCVEDQIDALGVLTNQVERLQTTAEAEVPDLQEAKEVLTRRDALARRHAELSQLVQAIDQLAYERDFASLQLQDAERELKIYTVCPVCGSKL